LHAPVELFRDDFGSAVRDAREKMSIFRRLEQGVRQRYVIALANQKPAHAILDRFGNPAVLRGKNGQPARHGFQY
jgi:hypothetical protein